MELYESSDVRTYVHATEESHLLHLDLYCASLDGDGEPLLPEGTYTVAGDTEAGSACSDYTFALQYFDDGDIDYADPVAGGTVTVAHTGNGYSITARMDMVRSSTGESLGTYEYTYDGSITFMDFLTRSWIRSVRRHW